MDCKGQMMEFYDHEERMKEMKNEQQLKRGDWVYVCDYDTDPHISKRIFVDYIEGSEYPYVVVNAQDEGDFLNGSKFSFTPYRYAKKVEHLPEYTMDELFVIVGKKFKIKK
jgi:hypothetical protein